MALEEPLMSQQKNEERSMEQSTGSRVTMAVEEPLMSQERSEEQSMEQPNGSCVPMALEESLMSQERSEDQSREQPTTVTRVRSRKLSVVFKEDRRRKSIDLLAHLLLNEPGALEQDFYEEAPTEESELKSAIEEAVEHRKKQIISRCDSAKKLLRAVVPDSPIRRQRSNPQNEELAIDICEKKKKNLKHYKSHKALSLLGDLHDHVDTMWSWEVFRAPQHVVHVDWSEDWISEMIEIMGFHGWELEDVDVKDNFDNPIDAPWLRGPLSLLKEKDRAGADFKIHWFPIHIEEKEPPRNALLGWLDKNLKLDIRVRCGMIVASIVLAVVIFWAVMAPSWLLLIPFLIMLCALYQKLPSPSFNVPVRFHCNSIRVRVTAMCFVTMILAISVSVGLLMETLTSVFTPFELLQNKRWYLGLLPALMMFCAFFIEGFVKLASDASRTTPLADFQVSVLLGVMSFTWPRFGAVILWFIGALALQLPSTPELALKFHIGAFAVDFVWARAVLIVVAVPVAAGLAKVLALSLARKQRPQDGIMTQAPERTWKNIAFLGFFFIYFFLICFLDEIAWGKVTPIVCFGFGTAAIMSLLKTRIEISKEKAGKDKRALVYPEHWECQVVDVIYFLVVEVLPFASGIRGAFKYHASPDGRGWIGALWRGYLWGAVCSVTALVMILQGCNLFMSGRASKAKRAILKALETERFPKTADSIRNCIFDDDEDTDVEKFRLGVERECHKELVRAFERQHIFPGILAQAPRAMFYEALQNTQQCVVGIIAYQAEMTNLRVQVFWHLWWSAFVTLLGYIIYFLSPSSDCSFSLSQILLMSLAAFLLILIVQLGWWLCLVQMGWWLCLERTDEAAQKIREKVCSEIRGRKPCVFWIVWCCVVAALSICIALFFWRGSCVTFSVIIGLLTLFIMMTSWALFVSSASYEKAGEKDLWLVPAVLPFFISMIAWILLTYLSRSWDTILQVVTLLPMSLLVVNFSTDAFHRIYPGVVGRSFWRISFVVWSVFVVLMLGPALGLPASEAAVRVFKPTSASIEKKLTRDKSHMYDLCDLRYGSAVELTALDLSQLAGVTYEENCSIIEKKLGLVFNDSSSRTVEMIHCTDYYDMPRIVVIDVSTNRINNNKKIRIIAIKGTSTVQDLFADATFYSSIKVLQTIAHLVPVIYLIPIDQVQWFLLRSHFPGQVLRERNFFDQAANNVSHWVKNFTGGDRTTDVMLTGHSLGGAFAQIIAAKLNLPALVFSSPGVMYSASRFGIYDNDLWSPWVGKGKVDPKSSFGVQVVRSRVHNIVPDFDQVPQVDRQLSMVDRIQCPHNDNSSIMGSGFQGAADCHSLDRTACEIWRVCGDIHERFFNCSGTVQDDDIGQWIAPDSHF